MSLCALLWWMDEEAASLAALSSCLDSSTLSLLLVRSLQSPADFIYLKRCARGDSGRLSKVPANRNAEFSSAWPIRWRDVAWRKISLHSERLWNFWQFLDYSSTFEAESYFGLTDARLYSRLLPQICVIPVNWATYECHLGYWILDILHESLMKSSSLSYVWNEGNGLEHTLRRLLQVRGE